MSLLPALLAGFILSQSFLAGSIGSAWARSEPGLTSNYQRASDPLTTAKLRILDPDELNPHRRNWVLERHIGLKGLESKALGSGLFGVQLSGLETEVTSYVRPEGAWYLPIQDFSCAGIKRHPWFSTAEGSRHAADFAAQFWNETLKQETLKIGHRFDRIAVRSASMALGKASQIYHGWLEQTSALWRTRMYERARKEELRFYQAQVAEGKYSCEDAPSAVSELIRQRMEPVSDLPLRKFLVRAPARRWEGAYSVRLSLEVGDKSLSGAFLIDSTAPKSMVSPSWLAEQGIPEAYVEVPEVEIERAVFSAQPRGGLAHRAGFDRVLMSGFALPVSEFLLHETQIFDVPKTIAPCCAGVLGNDFLRKFAIELNPSTPPEVILYEPLNYSEGKDALWEEASFYAPDAIASPCRLGAKSRSPIRWSLASSRALSGAEGLGKYLELSCGGKTVASQLNSEGSTPTLPTAGNPLMGKGPVTLDLPNGRIWFSRSFQDSKILNNQTGLGLAFTFRKAERVLVVQSIRPGSVAARSLLKAGLKPGMVVSQVDAISADEMDEWQVERHLAGAFGKAVSLSWNRLNSRELTTVKFDLPMP